MSEPARKKKILEKAERKLLAHIKHGDSTGKIESAAETVKASQLSFFKGQREIAQYENIMKSEKIASNITQHLRNIESQIKEWEAMDRNDIINLYRSFGS